MTIRQADSLYKNYYKRTFHTAEDDFLLIEALEFLARTTGEMDYYAELGGYYYENRFFDLALKYYEIAGDMGHDGALNGLGYIWYYGRTGKVDYAKALHYYSLAAEQGNIHSKLKVADMYKNGLSVEKDFGKYKQMVEEMYEDIGIPQYLNEPYPEICVRLADIRAKEGEKDEAVHLYESAVDFLSQRIKHDRFFGNVSIVLSAVDCLYKLKKAETEDIGFYDAMFFLKGKAKVTFRYAGGEYCIEAVKEDGRIVIKFADSWYRSREDFLLKALVNEQHITDLYDRFHLIEVQAG